MRPESQANIVRDAASAKAVRCVAERAAKQQSDEHRRGGDPAAAMTNAAAAAIHELHIIERLKSLRSRTNQSRPSVIRSCRKAPRRSRRVP